MGAFISISHWGLFEEVKHHFVLPHGFRLPYPEEVDAEMARPDGIIRLIKIGPPSFFERVFGGRNA